jgi:hypothetical protein
VQIIQILSKLKHLLFASTFLIICGTSIANSYGPFEVLESNPKSELWINPGLVSYHFDQKKDFNAVNYGIGAEYKFSSTASLTAGQYHNSYHNLTHYIGAFWQPVRVGPVQMGLVIGGFNGYTNTNNGGWFPALMPAFSMESQWIGLNILVIPSIQNHIAGSVAFQVKFKVFD